MAKDSINEFYKKLDELFDKGDLAKTEQYLLEQCSVQTGLEAVPPLNELASFYRNAGRFDEAEKYYEKTLDVLRTFNMAGTPQYSTVLINQATLLRMTGRTEDSIRVFRTAYEQADRESYVYVSVINNMALTILELGDVDEAEKLLKEAIQWIAAHGAAPHETGVTSVNLASVYIYAEKWTEASEWIETAIRAFDSQEQTDYHYASALAARAAIAVHDGRTEDAIHDYKEAMRLTEYFFGRNHEYYKAEEALKKLTQGD